MQAVHIISAIHTDAGKTLISAVLVAGLAANYWKPVQAGTEPHTDAQWIQKTLELPQSRIFPERFLLPYPESPHSSAQKAGVAIDLNDFQLPASDRPLVIEGAGGLFVPINAQHSLMDVFAAWAIPVTLVSRLYLGAINHTLLSVEALKSRSVPIRGIIFNGDDPYKVKSTILDFTGVRDLGHIPEIPNPNPHTLLAAFAHLKLD